MSFEGGVAALYLLLVCLLSTLKIGETPKCTDIVEHWNDHNGTLGGKTNFQCQQDADFTPAPPLCNSDDEEDDNGGSTTINSTHSHNHISSLCGSKCLELVELGGACEESAQCNEAVENSECSWLDGGGGGRRTCKCSAGFIATAPPILKPKRCSRRAAFVGEPCDESDNQCGLLGASCRHRQQGTPEKKNGHLLATCECLPGYQASVTGTWCTSSARKKKAGRRRNGMTTRLHGHYPDTPLFNAPVTTGTALASLGTVSLVALIMTFIMVKIVWTQLLGHVLTRKSERRPREVRMPVGNESVSSQSNLVFRKKRRKAGSSYYI